MDRQAAFFFRLATGGVRGWLHVIDLAADDAPVAGFRRFHALAKQKLAVIEDGKPRSHTGEIYAGCAMRLPEDQALPAISMKAGISSPKPIGVGPSSWSRR